MATGTNTTLMGTSIILIQCRYEYYNTGTNIITLRVTNIIMRLNPPRYEYDTNSTAIVYVLTTFDQLCNHFTVFVQTTVLKFKVDK